MKIFRFANNEFFLLLLVVPVLIFIFYYAFYKKKQAIKKFGNPDLILKLMPEASFFRGAFKFWILIFAIIFVILAIVRPQFGSRLKEVKRKGIEIVIALDVSNSMLTQDIKPNRLERAKQAISKLLDKLRNDKIGLIVFAGDAYVQVPITMDYGATKMMLASVNTNIVPKQGTSISSAIDLAMKSFTQNNEVNKAIIIITDGENHEDNAIEMAREARKKGIYVYTIGIGLPAGKPIPFTNEYGQQSFRKDKNGNVIISKLNEPMLAEIAHVGEGKYFKATNLQTGLNEFFKHIGDLEKTEFEAKVFSDYEERFPFFTWLAMILIVIEFFIMEKKNKRFSNLNLFQTKKMDKK